MNLKHAQYMYEIYKNDGNISRAAKKLYISQPALSQTIKLVESEIGCKIFERSTMPVSLTYAGRIYIDTIEKMLIMEANLKSSIREVQQEKAGTLCIGIPTQRASVLLPKILPAFQEKYPLVKIDIIEAGSNSMVDMVINNQVDMAFIAASKQYIYQLTMLKLCTENLILFFGSGTKISARKKHSNSITIEDLAGERFISLRKGHGMREIQDIIFSRHNIEPEILFEVENIELARKLAVSCNAVTFYPSTLLPPHIHLESDQPYFSVDQTEYDRNYYICYNKNNYLTGYMKDFIHLVKSFYH